MATYEFWLTDDRGVRIRILKDVAFASYTRAINGLGTCQFGLPLELVSDLVPYFQPDWRLEAWRSAAYGIPMRREDVFLLRKPVVYTRVDNVQMIQYYGRNGVDLLKRRVVAQRGGTSWAKKTDQIDDMMKAFVREQMLYGSALDEDGVVDNTRAWPQGEFLVQADGGLGPSVTRDFAERAVFEICTELAKTSKQLHEDASANRKIYFDIVPEIVTGAQSGSTLGWEFRTYAEARGTDRTSGLEFSMENENIKEPNFSVDRLDEVTAVWVRGNGKGASQKVVGVEDSTRVNASRWNRVEKSLNASNATTTAELQDAGEAELGKGIPKEELTVTLLNTPGSSSVPRSLYGIDWDLGDLVRVNYAARQFEAEIAAIYVSVDENGEEEITGRSVVQ